MSPTILRAHSAATWLYRCLLAAGRNCRGHRVNACGGFRRPLSRMRLVTAFPLWRVTLPVMSAAQDDSLSWLPAGHAGHCGGLAIFSVRLITRLAPWSHLGM